MNYVLKMMKKRVCKQRKLDEKEPGALYVFNTGTAGVLDTMYPHKGDPRPQRYGDDDFADKRDAKDEYEPPAAAE